MWLFWFWVVGTNKWPFQLHVGTDSPKLLCTLLATSLTWLIWFPCPQNPAARVSPALLRSAITANGPQFTENLSPRSHWVCGQQVCFRTYSLQETRSPAAPKNIHVCTPSTSLAVFFFFFNKHAPGRWLSAEDPGTSKVS